MLHTCKYIHGVKNTIIGNKYGNLCSNCISYKANALRYGMNPTILLSFMGK